jgi:hypothetical protein
MENGSTFPYRHVTIKTDGVTQKGRSAYDWLCRFKDVRRLRWQIREAFSEIRCQELRLTK